LDFLRLATRTPILLVLLPAYATRHLPQLRCVPVCDIFIGITEPQLLQVQRHSILSQVFTTNIEYLLPSCILANLIYSKRGQRQRDPFIRSAALPKYLRRYSRAERSVSKHNPRSRRKSGTRSGRKPKIHGSCSRATSFTICLAPSNSTEPSSAPEW